MSVPDDSLLPFLDLPPIAPRPPGPRGPTPESGPSALPPKTERPENAREAGVSDFSGQTGEVHPSAPDPAAPANEVPHPVEANASAHSGTETHPGASEDPDWKDALRRDFESWLATVEEIPQAETEYHEAEDAPDLYSFYAQFAAANTESRKANRRTAEAMSQWGETLARFEAGLQPLRDTTAQLIAAHPRTDELSRAHCLVWVELLDRMYRLARAFASPPVTKRRWWGGGANTAWRTAWEAQHQALEILVSHFEGLLSKEGVVRIETTGQPFDPAVMMAVAAEADPAHPPQTVLEELAAGYCRHDELLRPAQVKVSR
jgi:hypothetical protein